jgi:hypothetical protein
MNPKRQIRMLRLASVAAALSAAMFVAGGCEMNVQNPNAPDAKRAFKDPAGLAQLLGGAFRSWVETRQSYYIMALDVMADNYTASWNNAAIRLYTSIGADCPERCGWTNSAAATETAGGPEVSDSWYGYYTVLSGANDVLKAIALGTCFDDNCSADNTKTVRNKAIAEMLQGMAFAGLSLLYDSLFIVDEKTDLANILKLPLSHRSAGRDSALAKFEAAYADAGAKSWSTEPAWMGVGAGTAYTNTQIRQVIRTMEAELIANWPRNGAENTAANWAKVALYASQGVSSGTPFDWQFYIDVGSRECGSDCVKTWGNSMSTERVHTRVAYLLTADHKDPWPNPNGNPCPYSGVSIWGTMDKRAGDGTYGPTDNFSGLGTFKATAKAGTDFACATSVIFPPSRGAYHQSNMQHIRYNYLGYRGEDGPGQDGTGQDPMYTGQMNDLLWAEGLIRSGGNLAVAADKINNSRVGRGGLAPASAGDGVPLLLAKLQYEQEIEFMGQGVDPFFIKRRTGTPATLYCVTVDGLCRGTPRQMPVPAKELLILVKEIYSYGGPSLPDMSVVGNLGGTGSGSKRTSVQSVRDIWNQYRAMARAAAQTHF